MAANSNFQKTPEEFAEEIKKVLSANVSKTIHLMTRANNLIKDTVQTFSEQERQAMSETELLERWLNFNVAAYTVINDHALSLLEKIISVAEGSISGNPPEKKKEQEQADIIISGRIGEKQSSYFLINNHYDHPLEVSFEASPLVSAENVMLSVTPVTFEPLSIKLKEGEQKTIKVTVEFSKDFIPGAVYTSKIHVLGFETRELVLSIEVLPDAPPKTQTQKTRARTGMSGTKPATRKKSPGSRNKKDNSKS